MRKKRDIVAGKAHCKRFVARYNKASRQIARQLLRREDMLERAKEKRQGETERTERAGRLMDKKHRENESLSKRLRE